MNLDDAIKHCEEVAMDKTNLAQTLWDSKEKARCKECAEEHNQLAQWLIELKMLKTEQQSSGSENPNNCDLISRQAVNTLVDELARAISDERCCISRGRSTATIMQDILDLPSVKPQEKTGYWIGIDDKPHEDYECNRCGYICSTFTANIKPSEEYKYCPNCGARMSENPTSSKPEISSYYGLKSYVRERSDKK